MTILAILPLLVTFGFFFAHPLNSFAFGHADLQKLIHESKPATIEELIPQLPQEFHENFTLIKKSHSQQAASEPFPRTVLFGSDAKLLMAFSGEPGSLGYENLEVIEFRDDTKRFEFHAITFPADSPMPIDGKPIFSQTNPAECRRCHTQDPRPNWEQYFTWRGAYGETDDYPKDSELVKLKFFLTGQFKTGR